MASIEPGQKAALHFYPKGVEVDGHADDVLRAVRELQPSPSQEMRHGDQDW